MTMLRLESLLSYQLEELYSTEVHIARDIPRLQEGAFSSELKALLHEHAKDSARHAEKLVEVLRRLGIVPHPGHSKVVDVLLKRALELCEMRGDPVVLDIGLTYTLGLIKSHERYVYNSAATLAEALNMVDIAKTLEVNAREEALAEQSCVVLAEDMIDTLCTEVTRRTLESSKGTGEAPVG